MNETLKSLTEQLKEELAKTPEVSAYLAARDAYMNNAALMTLINEYNVQTKVYDTEASKSEPDDLLLTSIKARVDTLYKEITENPTVVDFAAKEAAVAAIYNEIYETVQSVVAPEHEEHDCGGDCSHCHGCH